MSQNKYVRLLLDMIVFVIGTVLAKAVQFLLMPVYTTYMSTEAYGMAELTNNLSEFFLPIVTLCIYESVFRFTVGSSLKKEEIISVSIKIVSLSAFVGAIVLMAGNVLFHYQYAGYLYFVLYAYSYKMLIAYYVRGKGKTKIFAASGIVNATFLAFFSYILLVKLHWNVKGYLLAIGFAYTASMLFLFVGGKVYSDLVWGVETKKIGRELLEYSMPLIIYNIGYWITTMSGRYILLWTKGASTAGMYAAVVKLAAVINMFQQAFYAAFQLNTSREYESTEKETYFTNIFRLYSTIILIFGTITLSVSPLLAKFTLKKDFFEARVFLPVILFISVIDCMFCFYKTMYTTFKFTKRAVPSMLLGAIINIIIGSVTANQYGIWGICFASFLCYASQIIYRIIDVNRFVKIECNWKYIISSISLLLVQAIFLSKGSLIAISGSFIIAAFVILASMLICKEDIIKILKRCKNIIF